MRKMFLLISVSLIFGYLLGNQSVINESEPDQEVQSQSNIDPTIEQFFSEPVVGRLNVELDPEYSSTLIDAAPIFSLPEKPNDNFPVGNMSGIKPFDINEGADGMTLLRDWDVLELDIDGDGVMEKAMTNSIGYSDSPQLVRIVKEDKVLFEFTGAMVDVEEAHDKSGFILTTQNWRDKNGERVRYVIDEDGTIRPLWQQRHIGIEWENH